MTTYESTIIQDIHTPLIDRIPVRKGKQRPSLTPTPSPQTAVTKPANPMLILLPIVALIIMGMISLGAKLATMNRTQAGTGTAVHSGGATSAEGLSKEKTGINSKTINRLSPIFSAEIQHWAPQILSWAAAFDLDPDIVATIMQIESCGYPKAVSHAGAQGLFQVMPFHFDTGEDMLDPNINARRGLSYYAERLQQTTGNVYLAFAGYNGGHVAAATTWENWAAETQRYYRWSQGIYDDAKAGLTASPTLNEWMDAGGASLCQQAANYLQIQ